MTAPKPPATPPDDLQTRHGFRRDPKLVRMTEGLQDALDDLESCAPIDIVGVFSSIETAWREARRLSRTAPASHRTAEDVGEIGRQTLRTYAAGLSLIASGEGS